ncbi:MAG: trehalose synthase [Microscillaceae bacterium]|nr:trehalose synthase [Microscillaceae bacterium]
MSTIPDEKALPKSSKEKEEALRSEKPWKTFFEQAELVGKLLNEVFPAYLKKCRWFGGKSKKIKQMDIQHLMTFPVEDSVAFFVILEAIYVGTFSETYFLPLSWVAEAEELDNKALIAPCWLENKPGYLADALYVPACRKALMENLLRQKQVQVGKGVLHFERGKVLDSFPKDEAIQSVMLKAEQSNTSIIYNDRYFLKIYRHLFRETNPDYETTRFLTETAGFSNTPAYAGSITWKRPDLPDISIGLMQEKVENEGDAFTYFLPRIRQYFEKVRDRKIKFEELERIPPYTPRSIRELDPEIVDLVGYENLKSIEKLAQRTAEMHVAISSDKSNYLFMPIIFNEDYVVWLKNRLIYQFDRRQELAERSLETLEGLAREYAEAFLERKEEIINRILNFDESMLISKRIRIHGDYHLGQVLKQGDDFLFSI